MILTLLSFFVAITTVKSIARRDYWEFEYVGPGGCSTENNWYPREGLGPVTAPHDWWCHMMCWNELNCVAYEYCYGANCENNCILHEPKFGGDILGKRKSPTQKVPLGKDIYTKTNGYPSVKCFAAMRLERSYQFGLTYSDTINFPSWLGRGVVAVQEYVGTKVIVGSLLLGITALTLGGVYYKRKTEYTSISDPTLLHV